MAEKKIANKTIFSTPASGGGMSQIPYKLNANNTCDKIVIMGRQEKMDVSWLHWSQLGPRASGYFST